MSMGQWSKRFWHDIGAVAVVYLATSVDVPALEMQRSYTEIPLTSLPCLIEVAILQLTTDAIARPLSRRVRRGCVV